MDYPIFHAGMTGLDVCKELRTWSQAPILVLSVHDKEKDKVSALDLGADDYLTKPFNTGELLARIRAHIRRAKQVPSSVTVFESRGLKVDLSRHQVFRDGQEVKLTKTSFPFFIPCKKFRKSCKHIPYASEVGGHEYEGDTQTLRVISEISEKD
jgi:DNA-binding response OmpR family regulator